MNDDEGVLLEVNEHPARSRPVASVLSMVFILAVSFLGYALIKTVLFPVFVIIFLLVSNTSFFFPSRYVLTKEKIVIDRIIYRKSYPWSRFRGYLCDKNGIYLSPTKDPKRFDRFRGVFLVMGKENRESAVAVLQEVIDGANGNNTSGE